MGLSFANDQLNVKAAMNNGWIPDAVKPSR